MAYHLALPPELAKLHNVFHVSMLRRYRSDGSHILQVKIYKYMQIFYMMKSKRLLWLER